MVRDIGGGEVMEIRWRLERRGGRKIAAECGSESGPKRSGGRKIAIEPGSEPGLKQSGGRTGILRPSRLTTFNKKAERVDQGMPFAAVTFLPASKPCGSSVAR